MNYRDLRRWKKRLAHRRFIHRLTDPNMTVYRDGKVLFDIKKEKW